MCDTFVLSVLGSIASPDVTIGVDDMPLIFGYTSRGNDLVAIHCSSDACRPSVRRDRPRKQQFPAGSGTATGARTCWESRVCSGLVELEGGVSRR